MSVTFTYRQHGMSGALRDLHLDIAGFLPMSSGRLQGRRQRDVCVRSCQQTGEDERNASAAKGVMQ